MPSWLLAEADRRARGGKSLDLQEWMSLGRTIHALTALARAPAATQVTELLCRLPDRDAFGAWWALATALWSDESLVLVLSEGSVHMLLARIERVVEAAAPRLDLFQEAGIVLLALLRRRGRPEAGPVDAGTSRLRQLADRFEAIDRAFVASGQRREPRLKIASQIDRRPDVSTFVDSLAAALRGERVALIRMLED